MLPTDRVQSAGRERLNLAERVQRATDRIPMPRKIFPIIGAVGIGCFVLAPVAIVGKVRTKMASAYVAMLAIWIIYVLALANPDPAAQPSWPVRWSLIALPVVMAVLAHLGPLRRWYVPCRTVAMTLLWPVILIVALLNQLHGMHVSAYVGVIAAWVLAFVVLGWRAAKGMQDARLYEPPLARPGPARPPGQAGQAAAAACRRAGHRAARATRAGIPRSTAPGRRAWRRCTPTARRAISTARPSSSGRRSPSRMRWRSSTR